MLHHIFVSHSTTLFTVSLQIYLLCIVLKCALDVQPTTLTASTTVHSLSFWSKEITSLPVLEVLISPGYRSASSLVSFLFSLPYAFILFFSFFPPSCFLGFLSLSVVVFFPHGNGELIITCTFLNH